MTSRPRRAALATGLATVVLSLAAPRSTADAAPVPAPSAADHHRPSVGSCHDLASYTELGAQSDPTPAVSCGARHTLVTVAAPRLAPSVDVENEHQLLAVAEHLCAPAVRRALGTERQVALSAYSYVFFVPTRAERAQGASWLRCDLAKFGNRAPAALPAHVARLGTPPFRPAVARCLTGPTLRSTPCSAPHQWRAVDTVRHPDGAYPSDAAWGRFATRHCPQVVGGARFQDRYPSSYGWNRSGRRLLVCFAPTTR